MTAQRPGAGLAPSAAAPAATPPAGIDAAVRDLRGSAEAWAALGPRARASLLRRVQGDLAGVAGRWVAAGLTAKGLRPGTLGEAEEWLFLATVLRAVRLLRATLRGASAGPAPVTRARAARTQGDVLRVFPRDGLDRLLYRGLVGKVRVDARVDAAARPAAGQVAAVLGAGNASMLPAVDTLHQLFVEGRVAVLKPSPVNAYLAPLIEEAFAALVETDLLRLIHGGAAEGAYLCAHPGVDALHLTGSRETFERLSADPRGAAGAPGRRRPAKPFTAELGNVSPVIVVPGPWSERELVAQAAHLATWLVANAGFGCLTPRVIVQHERWPLRGRLLEALARTLERVETRPAYYPGAAGRLGGFLEAHPGAWRLGRPGPGHLPWVVVPDVDPAAADDVCFRREAFCGLVAETALPAPSAAAFVDEAVAFANRTLWGTLCATLLVHPASRREPATAAAVERALADLRYGTVTVNAPAFAAYYLQVLPWGAYPADDGDVQSGVGRTANSLLLTGVRKSVLAGPFTPRPDPITVTAARPARFARWLAACESRPPLRAARS